METIFRQHESDFDQLRRFIVQDSSAGILLSVSNDRTDPELREAARRGLSAERLKSYRQLLHRLHLRGVGRGGGDDIDFQASVEGWLMKATRKGYLCTENEPKQIRKSLDGVAECGILLVKPLQGHWYLYYFRDCTSANKQ